MLLDETSEQKGVSQFRINLFVICKTYVKDDVRKER